MRKRWSAIIRLHVSEGERIDPRGLGTQLYSAASPNQVIKINAYDWADSENQDRGRFGKLRNGAKTKAGPLEAEQLSRLGNIALVR